MDCTYKSNAGSTSRCHLARWHKPCSKNDLKLDIYTRNNNVGEDACSNQTVHCNDDDDDDDDDDDNPDGDDGLAGELMAADEGDDLDEKILHNVALLPEVTGCLWCPSICHPKHC